MPTTPGKSAPVPNPELLTALESLRDHSARLNALTDEANQIVSVVENYLANVCSIGLTTWVIISQGEEHSRSLDYCRLGAKFRIAIAYNSAGGSEYKAWSECARDEKLEAFAFLPTLIEKIATEAQELIAKAELTAGNVIKTIRQVGNILPAVVPPTSNSTKQPQPSR